MSKLRAGGYTLMILVILMTLDVIFGRSHTPLAMAAGAMYVAFRGERFGER